VTQRAARYPWRPERVRVGTVGRPHGLDGTFVVEGPCGWYDFGAGSRLLVAGAPAGVRRRGGTDARPLVALEGHEDREAAESLRGAALELPRAALPPPEEDAYYRFDLIGCTAVAGARELGRVRDVEDGVAHDVLVLDDAAETRIPFVSALVPVVDVPARRVEVVDGLV
jgi:16S rRNA processing protein RimM